VRKPLKTRRPAPSARLQFQCAIRSIPDRFAHSQDPPTRGKHSPPSCDFIFIPADAALVFLNVASLQVARAADSATTQTLSIGLAPQAAIPRSTVKVTLVAPWVTTKRSTRLMRGPFPVENCQELKTALREWKTKDEDSFSRLDRNAVRRPPRPCSLPTIPWSYSQ
jgi:hypothetical protein